MNGTTAAEIEGCSAEIEKSLQTTLERHLETFLGVRFLASEYSTGKTHSGRIDTLGLDENGCPVIIEYKRAMNENVINQGLFYLDWLMDHRAEFKLLVMEKIGKEPSNGIEWSRPRLLCIAGDFTRYDVHAVQQMNRNIELIRYRHYGSDLLLLELINATSIQHPTPEAEQKKPPKSNYRAVSEYYAQADEDLKNYYEGLKAFLLALGDDVQIAEMKYYYVFKRIKNFACVEIHPQSKKLLVYLKVNPDSTKLEDGFSRDVRKIGHFGTGDLELTIKSIDDLEKAKPLILKSYETS